MGILFHKMTGSGNDFIVIDNRKGLLTEDLNNKARLLCRDRFSIGADGLILIHNSEKADFSWRLFNSDGSEAEMCGNGARCAALFAYITGIAKKTMTFETKAGILSALISDPEKGLVSVQLTPFFDMRLDSDILIDGIIRKVDFVNTGVPHAVYIMEQGIDEVNIVDIGRKTRYNSLFEPNGTNVNFVQVINENTIRVRTYERGVEGETRACGTGSVASALIAAKKGFVKPPVKVIPSGGRELVVDWQDAGKVFLNGDALIVCKGEIEKGAFL